MASENAKAIYSLGGKIKAARKKSGMTQTDLAIAIGSNKSSISKIENGVRVPELLIVQKTADALNTDIAEFFRSSEEHLDPYFLQVQKRAESLSPEQRANLEMLINSALAMAGV